MNQDDMDVIEAQVGRLLKEFNFLTGTKHDKDTKDSEPSDPQTEYERFGDC